MKTTIAVSLLALAGLVVSCNETIEENKREGEILAAAPDTPTDGNEQPTIIDSEVVNFSGIALNKAANSELYDPGQFQKLILTSKIDSDTTVLFADDGVSWTYGAQGELQPIDHLQLVETPQGLNRLVFTLPGDDYWWVEDNKVSKRKLGADTGPNQFVNHSFDITRLSGDITTKKVLGVTRRALIVQFTDNIGIFTVVGDQTAAYEFKSDLPELTTGTLISAGETEQGGFWFSTSEGKLALLKLVENVWRWNMADLPTSQVSGTVVATAAWLSTDAQSAVGDVAVLTSEALYSVSGRPIAPASTTP